MQTASTQQNTVKDPVCGMEVTPEMAAGSSVYEGRTYFFCSRHCLEKFRAEPSAYLVQGLPIAPSGTQGHHQSLHPANVRRIYTCSRIAAAAMTLSSVSVITNALRLRRLTF